MQDQDGRFLPYHVSLSFLLDVNAATIERVSGIAIRSRVDTTVKRKSSLALWITLLNHRPYILRLAWWYILLGMTWKSFEIRWACSLPFAVPKRSLISRHPERPSFGFCAIDKVVTADPSAEPMVRTCETKCLVGWDNDVVLWFFFTWTLPSRKTGSTVTEPSLCPKARIGVPFSFLPVMWVIELIFETYFTTLTWNSAAIALTRVVTTWSRSTFRQVADKISYS